MPTGFTFPPGFDWHYGGESVQIRYMLPIGQHLVSRCWVMRVYTHPITGFDAEFVTEEDYRAFYMRHLPECYLDRSSFERDFMRKLQGKAA